MQGQPLLALTEPILVSSFYFTERNGHPHFLSLPTGKLVFFCECFSDWTHIYGHCHASSMFGRRHYVWNFAETLQSIKWILRTEFLWRVKQSWRSRENRFAHQQCNKGLFTYYVSQNQGFLDPPSPLRQQWSAFGLPPLPPSSAMVSIWLTPPPPFVSFRQHLPDAPFVLQFST